MKFVLIRPLLFIRLVSNTVHKQKERRFMRHWDHIFLLFQGKSMQFIL